MARDALQALQRCPYSTVMYVTSHAADRQQSDAYTASKNKGRLQIAALRANRETDIDLQTDTRDAIA